MRDPIGLYGAAVIRLKRSRRSRAQCGGESVPDCKNSKKLAFGESLMFVETCIWCRFSCSQNHDFVL